MQVIAQWAEGLAGSPTPGRPRLDWSLFGAHLQEAVMGPSTTAAMDLNSFLYLPLKRCELMVKAAHEMVAEHVDTRHARMSVAETVEVRGVMCNRDSSEIV